MTVSKLPLIVFGLSLTTLIFWFVGKNTNVYTWAITGAVFEILWLPMIAAIFILPVVSLVFWIRNKFSFKSLYFYSLLLSLTVASFMIWQ